MLGSGLGVSLQDTTQHGGTRKRSLGYSEQSDRLGLYLSLLILTIGAVALGARNLGARFFWFDDAGQFWMSQGQVHGSNFGTSQQSLQTGIEFARNGSNADPPGFTMLLRFWTEGVGTSAADLRSLPLLLIVLAGLAVASIEV